MGPSLPRTGRYRLKRDMSSLYVVGSLKIRTGPPLLEMGAGARINRKRALLTGVARIGQSIGKSDSDDLGAYRCR